MCTSCLILILTKIISGEGWVAQLSANLKNVFIRATNEKYGFQMHEFLLRDIINCINEEHLFLQDLGPRVDHRNDD